MAIMTCLGAIDLLAVATGELNSQPAANCTRLLAAIHAQAHQEVKGALGLLLVVWCKECSCMEYH